MAIPSAPSFLNSSAFRIPYGQRGSHAGPWPVGTADSLSRAGLRRLHASEAWAAASWRGEGVLVSRRIFVSGPFWRQGAHALSYSGPMPAGTGRAMLAGARTISVTDRSGAVSFSHASAQAACASVAASRWTVWRISSAAAQWRAMVMRMAWSRLIERARAPRRRQLVLAQA